MLIIGRKRDQKIIISDNIEITVLDIGRNRVRFGIEAPKDVLIHTKQQSSVGDENVGEGSGGAEPTTKTEKSDSPRSMTARRNGG